MKNTGKTINGVPVYTDPNAPKDVMDILNGNLISVPPQRGSKLQGITPWHKVTPADSRWYRIKHYIYERYITDWPESK